MDSSGSDLISWYLKELNQQLENEMLPVGGSTQDDQMHYTSFCAMLLTAFCRVFKQEDLNEAAEEEEELTSLTLRSQVDHLKSEWGFQRTFVKWIHQWTDAYKIEHNLGSLISRMEAAAYKIEGDLITAYRKKYVAENPWKLSHVLRKSQKRLENFHSEIEEALDDWSGLSCLIDLNYPFRKYYSYISLIDSVEENLEVISGKFDHDRDIAEQIDAFKNKLTQLRFFFDRVTKLDRLNSDYLKNGTAKDFYTHVASVAIRAAEESCAYRFKEMDTDIATRAVRGLLDLQEKIDPVAPQFLELNVGFLIVVVRYKSSFMESKYIAKLFLDYVLGVQREKHHWLLHCLVDWAINSQVRSEQYWKIFLADLSALLREALPLRGVVFGRDLISPSLFEVHKTKLWFLEQKIWLVKAEIFFLCQVESRTTFLQNTDGEIKYFHRGLEELKTCSEDTQNVELKNEKLILTPLEEVIREVESLHQSFELKKITEYNAKNTLSMMLLKVNLLKAGLYLMELLTNNAGVMAIGKDQIKKLHEGLKLLILFVSHHPVEHKKNVEIIYTRIEMVARGISSQYYTVIANRMTWTEIEKMTLSFFYLLAEIDLINTKLREMCYQFPRSNFPKTDGLGFITFLLVNIEELLNHKSESLTPMKHYVEQILLELRTLRSLLVQQDTEHPKLKDVGKAVIDIAYKVEYTIDSIEVGRASNWQYFLCLYYLLEEDIGHVKIQATKICEEKTSNDATVRNAANTSSRNMPRTSRLQVDQGLVLLNDEKK